MYFYLALSERDHAVDVSGKLAGIVDVPVEAVIHGTSLLGRPLLYIDRHVESMSHTSELTPSHRFLPQTAMKLNGP